MNKKLQALGRLPPGVMNKTEAEYAQNLELLKRAGEVLWFKFEGIKLRLANKTFYTADFAVMRSNCVLELHEVKGSISIFQDDAKVKIKIAAETYPFKFFLAVPVAKKQGGGWDVTEY